jgi:ribosomal-protein-serine acetyltransferase
MDQPAETLIRDQVVLRRYRADDADALEAAITGSLEHLLPWMPWAAVHSRTGVEEFLARTQEKWESGDAYDYAITVDGVAPLGSCSLMRRIGPGGLEVGYWIHSGWTGRGLVTMAAAALTRAAFELPGTTCVEIHHDEANRASGAVPRRLGYTLVSRTVPAADPERQSAPGESGVDLVHRIDRATASALLG